MFTRIINYIINWNNNTDSNPENIHCPVCGYYCLGNCGNGCIDKPFLYGLSK